MSVISPASIDGGSSVMTTRRTCALILFCGQPVDDAGRARIRAALAARNRDGGSSAQVRRVVIADEPPSIDAGEITDKGYLNQRAILDRRAALVERLYSERPGVDILVIE